VISTTEYCDPVFDPERQRLNDGAKHRREVCAAPGSKRTELQEPVIGAPSRLLCSRAFSLPRFLFREKKAGITARQRGNASASSLARQRDTASAQREPADGCRKSLQAGR
jgi:hypothetical protein